MTVDEIRISDLERQVREQNRTIIGIQNILRSAARYKHDDLATQVAGIQVLLEKAAEYQARSQRRGRR